MNKIPIFILLVIAGLSSCKKDDSSVFNQSPDERINETLANYQIKLTSAENGWKAIIYTQSGSAYSFYFKFNVQNRVNMYSDFDSASAVSPMESSYRLKSVQQPSLIFDTYSYVHVLADPNENVVVSSDVNGGPIGVGLRSDFEFYFDSTTTDTIKLIGRFNGSKATLIRATKQEADAFAARQLGNSLSFKNFNKIIQYFKRITIGTKQYDIQVNPTSRQIMFIWVAGNGSVQTFTTGFYYTIQGLAFTNPFTDGAQTVTGFTSINWNATTQVLNFTVNSSPATITGVAKPLVLDVNAARRWWQYSVDQNTYWISLSGFTVNGIVDAYNVNAIPNFVYLLYWARINSTSSTFYDAFAATYVNNNNALSIYGPALFPPTFTVDGRVIFRELGSLGTSPSAATTIIVNNTKAQMLEPNGYYLVQTSETSYDMVSARDARSWISWEF